MLLVQPSIKLFVKVSNPVSIHYMLLVQFTTFPIAESTDRIVSIHYMLLVQQQLYFLLLLQQGFNTLYVVGSNFSIIEF